MQGATIREVRDGDGALLMKWVRAAVAEICDECSDPIAPGEEMATRQVPLPIDSFGRKHHVHRTWCKECGELLEDSLVTTEAVQ